MGSGLQRATPAHRDLFAVLGADRLKRFWRLELPAALPALASGLRLAWPAALIGAIIGAILMRWPHLLSGRHGSGTPRLKKSTERKIRPRTSINLEKDSEVDLILDKISREGFQSLTEREREVLREAANQSSTDS